jgi:ubiquinone biosynthesis protein
MSAVGSAMSLLRAAFVLSREGVISLLPAEGLPPPLRLAHRLAGWIARPRAADAGERVTLALNRLGPSFVKLGQFLATRPDIVGRRAAADLANLQDRMQAFPAATAREIVSRSLGRPVDQLFSGFPEAVAAASIAQVHRAIRAADGRPVAVKVVRPGVRERFRRDLANFRTLAQWAERRFAEARRLRPVEALAILEQSATVEMDMRLEAAALSELRHNIAADKGFRAPDPDWSLTGRDCLTMEWVEGVKLTDREALLAAGHDPVRLAANLVQSFLRHTLRDGFFHADLHPGNLFVDAAGDIVAVDLGITGRLGRKERRFLAEILYGFIKRDYRRVAEVHIEAGYVPARHSVEAFAQAIRAIGEPIHGQPADTISMAKLLTLLFEVTELFDMQTRPELILLQKTMVVTEGVARQLDPAFNMWKTAEPVVGEWLARHVGPGGMIEDAVEGLAAARTLLRRLPELAADAEALAARFRASSGGFPIDPASVEAIGQAEARGNRWSAAALWMIALIALFSAYWIFST